MANDDTKPGFWGWAQKHWFLTFLLAGSAIALPVNLVAAAKGPAPTPSGPPTGGTDLAVGNRIIVDSLQVAGFQQTPGNTTDVTMTVTSLDSSKGLPFIQARDNSGIVFDVPRVAIKANLH